MGGMRRNEERQAPLVKMISPKQTAEKEVQDFPWREGGGDQAGMGEMRSLRGAIAPL